MASAQHELELGRTQVHGNLQGIILGLDLVISNGGPRTKPSSMKAFSTADLLPKSLLYGTSRWHKPACWQLTSLFYKATIMGLTSAEAAQIALRSMVLHQTPQRRYHSSQYSAHWLVHYSLFNNHATTQEMQLIAHQELPISCYPPTLVHCVSTHRQHNNAPHIQPNQSHVFIGIFPLEPVTHTNTVRLT